MKYKGIELKKITEPQIFNPPKKMLVWSRESDVNPTEHYVYAIVNRGADSCPVICQYATWKYCAEIPEVPELVTYRELPVGLRKAMAKQCGRALFYLIGITQPMKRTKLLTNVCQSESGTKRNGTSRQENTSDWKTNRCASIVKNRTRRLQDI